MSKAKLKKYIQTLSKEQVDDIVLQLYSASKEAKTWLEFYLEPNSDTELEMVVLITPLSFLVAAFIAKKTFVMFRAQSETRGEQTALIEEMIGNQKVVQAFSHEDEALEESAVDLVKLF